ncbi:MAG: helix-hairpin-helix domain-containing protein [Candidatus Margulisbacteria bacterium]|nr:helix-hairpin-helix domain-containing protein [Candidatus Margulisiibacteriota bacterium]
MNLLTNLTKEQQLILVGLIFVIIAGLGVMVYRHFVTNGQDQVLIDAPQNELSQSDIQVVKQDKILVHISGAVKKEGVYRLEFGDRVMDAIELAGGITALADLSSLNLAEIVKDGQKIIVPGKQIMADRVSGNQGIRGSGTLSLNAKVNLNSATEKELQKIPGVGPSTAKKIIDYRTTNGPFTKLDDLMKVKGIGKGKYEKMKDKISI